MRVRVENWFGVPFRIDVFDAQDNLVIEGQRTIQGNDLVGGWHWKPLPLTDPAKFIISGSCYTCGCYELRSLGWCTPHCLPGHFHLWTRPE